MINSEKLHWFDCSRGFLKLKNVAKAIKFHCGSIYVSSQNHNNWKKVDFNDPMEFLRNFWIREVKDQPKIMLGYLSYGFAGYLESKVFDKRKQIIDFPDFYFVVSDDYCFEDTSLRGGTSNLTLSGEMSGDSCFNLIPDEEYKSLILKAKELIREGELYEINISRPLLYEMNHAMSHYDFAQNLFSGSISPYSAYFPLDRQKAICSLSPECFLKKTGNNVSTFPIKGTRRRSSNNQEDQSLIQELLNSEKESAEHLMVVDLERNDLGRIAVPSSVKVKKHAELNSFESIHHLISEVSCQIKPDLDVFDLIKATFPSGSVTGAPKIRTMQAICDIEPFPRSVYTGSLGFIDSSGDCEFSILIRTCLLESQKILLNVGGGIVWDSDPDFENQETYVKANSVLGD